MLRRRSKDRPEPRAPNEAAKDLAEAAKQLSVAAVNFAESAKPPPREVKPPDQPTKQGPQAAVSVEVQQNGAKTTVNLEIGGGDGGKKKGAPSLRATIQAIANDPGAAPLWAAFRQGVHELGTAFGKALPDSIQVDEPGSHGTAPTPQDVFNEKKGIERDIEV